MPFVILTLFFMGAFLSSAEEGYSLTSFGVGDDLVALALVEGSVPCTYWGSSPGKVQPHKSSTGLRC